MSKIVSVDLETTGLLPERHDAWEVAIVPLDAAADSLHYQFPPVNLLDAEPKALEISGFYDRFQWISEPVYARDMQVDGEIEVEEGVRKESGQKALMAASEAIYTICKTLQGATIMGLNPHFDAAFLEELIGRYGHAKTWSHRYLDLGSFAAGTWGAAIPLSGAAIRERIPQEDGLHSAYMDAMWNVECFEQLKGWE